MKHKIENDFLIVEARERGAELCSLYSKQTGYEYLWQGDPEIWSGQSPILFPIVGRLLDDKYRLNGKEYSLPKHGFARVSDFICVSNTGGEMTFVLNENEETLIAYPYKFELRVKYALDQNRLAVSHTVVNKNGGTMYFSLGAHPGFNCETGDCIEFEQKETLDAEELDLSVSLRTGGRRRILSDSNRLALSENIFEKDALLMTGVKSSFLCLRSPRHERSLRFYTGNPPCLGLWAKPGAPYVCVEPWFGLNDSYEYKDDLSKKDAIQSAEAGGSLTFTWSAEIF